MAALVAVGDSDPPPSISGLSGTPGGGGGSCARVQQLHGPDVAAAFFALSCGGGARFRGQDEWLRADGGGRWRAELLRLRHLPVVALDLRGSDVGYGGLEHLVRLPELEHLDLGGCGRLDDWGVARLHPLAGSLRELSLAACPRVTERGLAALHHLRLLRRLDVSELPAVSHPALVRILLEEMLPGCRVLGMEERAGGGGTRRHAGQ
ncbi:distal membrane-arm assembly complex protein 2 [Eudromia elegans]